MAGKITRITLFKIPDEESQKKVLGFYQQMPQKALKAYVVTFPSAKMRDLALTNQVANVPQDGEPYILSVKAALAVADQRAQGFTIAAISTFASAEDMAYYDNECAAHAELKAFAKGAHQGFAMVYFKD
ncbi:hypothetical protein GCG54_00008527 [Colletotrichum gloeosporioides]|uniref:Stress-response A/B barrel domain-containing protein n=1 Tax=Colletotrichum gloeosporioides TaxID=474922 RepID=A0A8H4CHG5_COLGL|nr:uncharacterized protein GCG54_00008527 [Colletotrichum gloeosporioides]KAF3804023.1 hypothetical protein GCG54_00008527 [Colletotrichum gloeosporioides]